MAPRDGRGHVKARGAGISHEIRLMVKWKKDGTCFRAEPWLFCRLGFAFLILRENISSGPREQDRPLSGGVSVHDSYELRFTLLSWAGVEVRRGGEQVLGVCAVHAPGSCSACHWKGHRTGETVPL